MKFLEIMETVFLTELPRFTGKAVDNSNYAFLIGNKEQNKQFGNIAQILSNGIQIMNFGKDALVWMEEEDGTIPIIASLNLFNDFPAIQSVGKLPGSSVYASDFYMKLVNIFGKLLFSGDAVSSDAVKLWKNMARHGFNIFVYDPNNSSKYKKISDSDELDKYLGTTSDYEQSRFVLSKNATITESIIQVFDMYRLHQLINHKS